MTLKPLIPLLVLACLVPASLQAGDQTRSISTVGVAERRYPAERANVYLNIDILRPTSAEASESVSRVHEQVLRALTEVGVAPKDFRLITRTTGRRTRWDHEKEERIYLGQYCREDLQLVVRDLSRLETITTALAGFQDVNVGGMIFESDQEGAEKRAALLDAAKAAEEKARDLARAAGVRITGVLEIEEQHANNEYYNTASNTARMAEPGEGLALLALTVTIRARYSIE